MELDLTGMWVIFLTLAALVLLATHRASLDAIGICLIVALVASQVLDLKQALHGFANYAVITIGALYVIGEGLTRTGAVEFLAQFVLRKSGGKETQLILWMSLIVAFSSAFINNTAVVVVFIPVLIGVAKSTGIPASRLLMPLSFAALLGGMCTLVGTSTNLLVSGVAEELGLPRLSMFEMSPIGVPMTLVCVGFVAVFTKKLLPIRHSLTSMMAEEDSREYVTELVFGPNSKLLGKSYGEVFAAQRTRVTFYVREEQMHWAPFDDHKIEAGDAVMLKGSVDELADMQTKLGLKFIGDVKFDPQNMHFFELAVSPRSSVKDSRVGDLYLFRDYNTVPVAVLREGHHIHQRVSDLVLHTGDLLLAYGDESSLAKIRASSDFFLLTGAHKQVVLRSHAKRALVVAAAVVALFTLNTVFHLKSIEMPVVALAGAVAMVASGCVSTRRAYRSIDWPILFFIVGMLALGSAMNETGAAAFFAKGIVSSLAGMGPAVVVCGLVFLCMVFNALVSHSAVAVLLTPIAIDAARQVVELEGALPGSGYALAVQRAFILAIAFGGSICFFTPIGHQTNLMVYGPGGYRYSDYLKLGIPVSLIAWLMVSLMLPWMTDI